MPKLSDISRIIPEEFKSEDQDMVSSIAGSYNGFADELYEIINGQIDFDNLARRKVSIDLNIGSNGSIIGNGSINTGLTFVSGIYVMKFISANSQRPTTAPAVSFTYKGGGLLTIDYVVGLPIGKWNLTLEIVQ